MYSKQTQKGYSIVYGGLYTVHVQCPILYYARILIQLSIDIFLLELINLHQKKQLFPNILKLVRKYRFVKDGHPELSPALSSCHVDEFQCSNGRCISEHRRCDNHRDCEDGSDEKQCGKAGMTIFWIFSQFIELLSYLGPRNRYNERYIVNYVLCTTS